MAWNQPGEDRKKPPPRGAPEDSSLDEMLRRWQQRVQRLWRPGRSGGTAAAALLLLVVAVWLASGYYQIDSSERGVVQRFGRFSAVEQPGHGWHWPWPIESLTKLNVASIEGLDSKALMLTADQSLIDVNWSVQYRITDPQQFLFQVREPASTLRQSSETVIRELVAATDMQALLVGDARARITGQARGRIQTMLNDYQAGITVSSVNLLDVQLPDSVVSAQRDAEKAAEDRQRAIADAESYANDILPKAQASAQRQLADAQVYAAQTLASAEGDADRFTQLANAYAQAPDVTRSRLYIETMESIFSRSHKIIIDARSGGGNMIYLPLDKLADAVRAAAVPSAPSAASTPGAGAAAAGAGAGAGVSPGSAAGDRSDQDDRGRERTDR
jgi:membrane protease subunit HflK